MSDAFTKLDARRTAFLRGNQMFFVAIHLNGRHFSGSLHQFKANKQRRASTRGSSRGDSSYLLCPSNLRMAAAASKRWAPFRCRARDVASSAVPHSPIAKIAIGSSSR